MMGDRPRIELSTVQLVSSMGAAVTGAILTSYLGDGGTIVGTAVGAGASTAGFAVYKHYLVRTKEKVAPVIVEHARQWSPVTGSQTPRGTPPGAQGTPGGQGTAARSATDPNRAPNGATVRGANVSRYASPTSADQTRPPHAADPGPRDPGDGRTRGFEQPETQTMRPFGTVRMNSAGHDGGPGGTGRPGAPANFASDGPGNGRDGDGAGPGKHGKGSGGRFARGLRDHPGWVVTAATTAAVFLIAMLVITLIEFGTGKPIDASVWGRSSSGTTLGNVTGSHSSSRSGTVTPTVSPTPTQSATPGGVGQTAPQPTSSVTTAPTPSSVPSVSTAPSQNAPASVAPTGQSQQAPGQQAPSQQAPGQQAPGQQAPDQ
jgi:hypothetical protein